VGIFFFPKSGVDSASKNECQNIPGGKGVGVATVPPSCAECLEIWQPQPTGTLRACPGLYLYLMFCLKHTAWLFYRVSAQSRQKDVPADGDFVCDKAAVIGDRVNRTLNFVIFEPNQIYKWREATLRNLQTTVLVPS
jgi:hypothetical protein